MRFAFLVSYFGDGFHGLVRQPGLRTVEGELLSVLSDLGYLNPSDARSMFAGRTDKGVSALQNVWAVNLIRPPVLGQINAELEGIFLYGYVRVDDSFNPLRSARKKWYRYVFPRRFGRRDLERMRRAAEILTGEHDFSSFCIPEGRKTRRSVDRIEIFNQGMTVMDIFAKGFLRQQVRRIAYALYMVGEGAWTLEDVRRRLEERDPVPPMPAEGLVLVRVYMDTYIPADEEQLRRMLSAWEERRTRARVLADVYGTHVWFQI